MKFHIDKQSEITPHEQLREQIIFLISTGELAIGAEMPSVRALSRQLGISLNTVSKVYSELVRACWLIERPGAHHSVVERRDANTVLPPVADMDDLIDRTIGLARAHGYSLQQLAARIRWRLLEQPPDHFLVVEPDPGMGELMREEIRKRIGYASTTCGIHLLQQNPGIGIGAILITPAYLVDKLSSVPLHRCQVIPVEYAPLDKIISTISELTQPSMVGLLSVSGAGLKTVSGMIAPAIGKRHSIHLFLMERHDPKNGSQYSLRRYKLKEYHPADILKPAADEKTIEWKAHDPKLEEHTDDSTVSAADLRGMDVLVCDSITSSLIHHPRQIKYQLLSEQSLDRIEAEAAATLPRHPNL